MKPRILLLLLAALLAGACPSRAGDAAPALRAIATTDVTEVHPDDVFDVTLSLENLSATTAHVRVPDCGWDRCWKSNNGKVTWDFWDCDNTYQITIDILPHQTYVFQKPLKMFVSEGFKPSRVTFKMGFKTGGAFSKLTWSAPITLDVTP